MIHLLLLLFMFNAFAVVETVNSFIDSKVLHDASTDTLIVLDIDGTLIYAEDIFDNPECYKVLMGLIKQGYTKITTPEEREAYQKIISLIFLEPKRYLLEPEIPELLNSLNSKGVKIIALTSCLNGKYGLLDKVENWRFDNLDGLGINFSNAFSLAPFYLEGFPEKNHNPPLFDRGILYCYGYSKGDTLKAFLKAISYHPSRILFADDILANVEDVHEKLEPIPVDGYHFTGSQLPSERYNPDLIRFQYDYLIQHHKWLPDVEALKLLNKEPL